MSNSIIFQLIVAFFLATIIAPVFIPFLRRLKFGQAIREEGPQSHRKKSGTPTMGGIIFITSIIVTIICSIVFTNHLTLTDDLIMLLMTLIGFGLIGFIDDFIIVVRKNNEGLKPKQKVLAQLALAAIFFSMFLVNGHSTELSMFNFSVELYWGFGLFILFWMIGFSNAVNLTDGLDGLCGGVSVIVFSTFGMIALAQHQPDIALFCFTVVGALLGFLVFNLNPAKVFMGDTGSLALGAAIAAVSILLKQELILLVIGLVYVIEALSVIIQVLYYKRTKKRIFKMAPIHHHFEECGWSEWKVVIVLWTVSLICGIVGLLMVI